MAAIRRYIKHKTSWKRKLYVHFS